MRWPPHEDGGGARPPAKRKSPGAGEEVISKGTRAGKGPPLGRPSRANRRHVNNWLADDPLRRAVTDTKRVKARHAAYVMSEYWNGPIDQIDWDARAVRLLIEAVCESAGTPLPLHGAPEAER